MRKIIILLISLVLMSCEDEIKNYASFSGKIRNKNSDSIIVRSDSYSKTISVNKEGVFSDTLIVTPGVYNFFDGKESSFIFLRNGYDINMTLDAKDFHKSIAFSGIGSKHSSFIAENNLLYQELIDLKTLSSLDMNGLNSEFENIKQKLTDFYDANNDIDTLITNRLRKDLDPTLNYYKLYIAKSIALKTNTSKGSLSPVFENYENFNGGTTSLTDLKGKYVYIDVWATWCRPCLAEIPSLKKLEEKYHSKNIQFVSISVDEGRGYRATTDEESKALAKEAWRNMVAKKELGGIQLIAPNGWQSQFIQAYKINGIPRFILIDPQGNIVTPNAPRPTGNAIVELFNKLGI